MYLVKTGNFHLVGNWVFLKLNFGPPILFLEISVSWRKRHKWSEERDISKCTLIEVKFIWTTLCQEGIKLCVGLLWYLLKTLGTESAVCLCSQQQFTNLTANTVAERDWISWWTVGTDVTKSAVAFVSRNPNHRCACSHTSKDLNALEISTLSSYSTEYYLS